MVYLNSSLGSFFFLVRDGEVKIYSPFGNGQEVYEFEKSPNMNISRLAACRQIGNLTCVLNRLVNFFHVTLRILSF